jgi:hypothetical protein
MSATAARTRWLAVPIVALSVVGLAACGSSDSTAETSSTSASTTGTAAPGGEPAGMAAFQQCMSEHGVSRPSRPDGAAGGAAGGASGGVPAGGVPAGGESAGEPGGPGGPGGAHHDPTKAPPGVDQSTWTTARAACASLAPTPPAAPGN